MGVRHGGERLPNGTQKRVPYRRRFIAPKNLSTTASPLVTPMGQIWMENNIRQWMVEQQKRNTGVLRKASQNEQKSNKDSQFVYCNQW